MSPRLILWAGLSALLLTISHAQQIPRDLSATIAVTAANEVSNLDRKTGRVVSKISISLVTQGTSPVEAPLHAAISFTGEGDLSQVQVAGALGGLGQAPYQTHYLDLSTQAGNGIAVDGQLDFQLEFSRPSALKVLYQVRIFGIANREPLAGFTAPAETVAGSEAAFDAAESTDPDGDALTYRWEFDRGVTAEGLTPRHSFETPGIYDVNLVVRDPKGLEASARRTVLVVPEGNFALVRTRTLDDCGVPLGGVTVERLDSPGGGTSDPDDGYLVLGGEAGFHAWRFSKPGYLPVWREAVLPDRQVLLLPSPWMTPIQPQGVSVSPLDASRVGGIDQAARILFPAGAFSDPGEARLTTLDGQALPFPLPAGWSPLAAVHLGGPGDGLLQAGTATWHPAEPLRADDVAAVVRFDESSRRWIVVATPPPGELVESGFASFGFQALAVADAARPPAPVVDAPLEGVTESPLPAVAAQGSTVPEKRSASLDPELVKTTARVLFAAESAQASGRVFRTDISENYQFVGGAPFRAADRDATFFAYQRPGDDDERTLEARFPLRPSRLFSPAELDVATVQAGIFDAREFRSAILGPEGGVVSLGDIRLQAAVGALNRPTALEIRRVDPAATQNLLGGLQGSAFFQLNFAGGGALLDPAFIVVEPDVDYVLARVLTVGSQQGLDPLLRLRSGSDGVARPVEPAAEPRLPGLGAGGTLVLVKLSSPQGIVTGITRGLDGQPKPGLLVRIDGQPWMTTSKTGGAWKLLAPAGNGKALLFDPDDGNGGEGDFTLENPDATAQTDLQTRPTGPRVVSISPADGATKVRAVEPVIVLFSEALAPATVGFAGVTLVREGSTIPVAASLTLNSASTTVSLLPTDPLENGAVYQIRISPAITDPSGLPIEGNLESSFTVLPPENRGEGGQLVIHEPGAADVPQAVLSLLTGYSSAEGSSHVVAHGSPGTADPGVPVILVNETSGETVTVLSKPDGSFASFIRAEEEDFIKAVFVNFNDTRVEVPATRQLFDNGQIGLYKYGGILEAQSDGGPVQVIVDPNVIPSRVKFKLRPFPFDEMRELVGDVPPQGSQFAAPAIEIELDGDQLSEGNNGIRVSFPLTADQRAALGVPNEEDMVNRSFAVVAPAVVDGVVTYAFLDEMHYVNGTLETRSPPFPGADYFLRDPDTGLTPPERLEKIGAALLPAPDAAEQLAEQRRLTRFLNSGQNAASFVSNEFSKAAGVASSPTFASIVRASVLQSIIYLEATQPSRILGRVVELTFDEDGDPLQARPLAGAFVTASRSGSLANPIPGKLNPGAVFTTSDAAGKFAISLPSLPVDRDGFPTDIHAVRASHSRYPGITITKAWTSGVDVLVFPHFKPVFPDSRPPSVVIVHDPVFPALGEPISLRVLATHSSSVPEVEIEVINAIPLDPATPIRRDDITVGAPDFVDLADGVRRYTFNIEAAVAAKVTLDVKARVYGGRTGHNPYPVTFGGVPPGPGSGDPEPSDLTDEEPPKVIRASPPELAIWLPPADITIEFNEPVSRRLLDSTSAVSVLPADGPLLLDLSEDQRVLTIRYPGAKPGGNYTFTINNEVTDLANNSLDQDPSTDNPDAFVLNLQTPSVPKSILQGVENGGGAVIRGIYAYVLERAGALDGSIVVYDLSDPKNPAKVGELSVPGYPRDLALIPDFSFKRTPAGNVETRDLLAVVGGKIPGTVDNQGNFTGFQYLWVIDISDPTKPVRLSANAVSGGGITALTRVEWSPPFLSYLDFGADSQTVNFATLQTLILVSNMTREQFTSNLGTSGRDFNGDGDFVDPGEILPVPGRNDIPFAGYAAGFQVTDTNQVLQDYDYDPDRAQLAVVLKGGLLREADGRVGTNPVAPCLRILMRQFTPLPRESASLTFDGRIPRRVKLLSSVGVLVEGVVRLMDLALVTVDAGDGAPPELVIVDVTDPLDLRKLSKIVSPNGSSFLGIEARDDGIVGVSVGGSVMLLDPLRFGSAPEFGETHVAVIGIIPDAGVGARSFGLDRSGLVVSSLGGKNVVSQFPPELQFVNTDPDLDLIRDATGTGAALFKNDGLLPIGAALPARLTTVPNTREPGNNIVTSTLSPAKGRDHQYVVIHAPGSAGDEGGEIDVIVESLDGSGQALSNRGAGFAPVRAASSATLDRINGNSTPCGLAIRSLKARRLSDEKGSPLYNVFLSKPIALTYEAISITEMHDLMTEADRVILWSGSFLRATIDESERDSAGVAGFTSYVDTARRRLLPGPLALVRSVPADYIMGPNPPPVGGSTTLPGTSGTVVAHSGETRLSAVDFALPGRRLSIVFSRFCGGQDLHEGIFGRGWDFNFNQRIQTLSAIGFPGDSTRRPLIVRGSGDDRVAENADIIVHAGDGRPLLFRHRGDSPADVPDAAAGNEAADMSKIYTDDPLVAELGWNDTAKVADYYQPEEGVFDLLVRFKDGRFARLESDGSQHWYRADGRLEKIQHRYDLNRITLSYNRNGELSKITDHSSSPARYLELGYYRATPQDRLPNSPDQSIEAPKNPVQGPLPANSVGKVCAIRDYTGRDVLFEYDECNRLTTKHGIEITVGHEKSFKGRERTEYVSTNPGTPGHSDKANGQSGVIEGSDDGLPVFSATALVPGSTVPQLMEGNGQFNKHTMRYAHANSAAGMALGDSRKTTVTRPGGDTVEHLFYPDGRLAALASIGERSPNVQAHFEYEQGLLKKVTYPKGNSVEFVHDLDNPRLRSRANVITTITRAAPGSPEAGEEVVVEHEGPNNGYNPKYNFPEGTLKTANGFSLQLEAAEGGKDLGKTIHPDSNTQETTYNEFGQVVFSKNLAGFTSAIGNYDERGFATVTKKGDISTILDYAGRDGDRGYPTSITPPNGADIILSYNEVGSLITRTQGNLESKLSHDIQQRQVRGELKVDDDGATVVEERAYLQNGFLLSISQKDIETDGEAADLVTTMTPDERFRVARIDYQPGGQFRTFEDYDHRDRPLRTVLGGDYTETYTFDLNGNLQSKTRDDATDELVYDGFDRLSTTKTALGSGEFETTNITYHPGGEPKKIQIFGADDALNREESFVVDSSGRVIEATRKADEGEAVTETVFDGRARTITMTSPEQEVAVATYLASGQLHTAISSVASITNTYDGNNPRRVTVDESIDTAHIPGVTDFFRVPTFDNLNYPTGMSDNLGHLTTMTPRLDGRNTSVTNASLHTTEVGLSKLGEARSVKRSNGIEFRHEYASHRAPSAVTDKTGQGHKTIYDTSFRPDKETNRAGGETKFGNFDKRHDQPQLISLPGGSPMQVSYDAKGRPLGIDIVFAGTTRSQTFSFDALDRITSTTFPVGRSEHFYNLLGPIKKSNLFIDGSPYSVEAGYRKDGTRTSLTYPATSGQTIVKVAEARDTAGRLLSLTPDSGPSVVDGDIGYAAAKLPGTVGIGDGALTRRDYYDARQRLIGRSYVNGDGGTVADVRYVYDGAGNVLARQYLHRVGRTDLFSYDEGERLVSAHIGARVPVDNADPRPFPGFNPAAGMSVAFEPGYHARNYAYDTDGLDLLSETTETNPDILPAPPFTSRFSGGDGFLNYQTTDGVVRSTDFLGNVTRARLFVRNPGDLEASPVNANLLYNGLSQLIRIARDDGVIIHYEYDAAGMMVHRKIERPGAALPEVEHYVWHEGSVIAVFDKSTGQNRLKARMYYALDDSPIAADVDDGEGGLRRVYYLQENNQSVMAVTDDAGVILERYQYDAWGQPIIEGPDTTAPVIKQVVRDATGFLVEFNERILPPMTGVPTTGLASSSASVIDAISITAAGGQAGGACALAERVPGFPFSTVIRVEPGQVTDGIMTLTLRAGGLVDEAGNPVAAQTLVLNANVPPGAPLAMADESPFPPPPPPVAHAPTRNPFLFHGQIFDYDAGLFYMRARFYDPSTGAFIQRDPMEYADSVNHYAGFRHNPTSLRDPSGEWVHIGAGAIIGAAMGAATEWAFNSDSDAQSIANAALGGMVAGAFTAATMGTGAGVAALSARTILIGGASNVIGGVVTRGANAAFYAGKNDQVVSGTVAVKDFVIGLGFTIVGDKIGKVAASLAKKVRNVNARRIAEQTLDDQLLPSSHSNRNSPDVPAVLADWEENLLSNAQNARSRIAPNVGMFAMHSNARSAGVNTAKGVVSTAVRAANVVDIIRKTLKPGQDTLVLCMCQAGRDLDGVAAQISRMLPNLKIYASTRDMRIGSESDYIFRVEFEAGETLLNESSIKAFRAFKKGEVEQDNISVSLLNSLIRKYDD